MRAELDGQWSQRKIGLAGGRLHGRRRGTAGSDGSPSSSSGVWHLIANNTRFVLLPGPASAQPGLADVLGLSLRRLTERDMRWALQAGIRCWWPRPGSWTPSHFAGILLPGLQLHPFVGSMTRELPASARRQRRCEGPSHGPTQGDRILYRLQPDACRQLSRPAQTPPIGPASGEWNPSATGDRLRSLFECRRRVKEFRKPRGKRYHAGHPGWRWRWRPPRRLWLR